MKMTSKTWLVIIHIKPLSKYFDITLIRNFLDQTLKFDRFIDILSHQTHVKFLDRIYTSNPSTNCQMSGRASPLPFSVSMGSPVQTNLRHARPQIVTRVHAVN
jgi:hypothetical protein